MRAGLFGSIGALVETSEVQRAAFNAAFAEARRDWVLDRGTCNESLHPSGGRARIEAFARQASVKVDPAVLLGRKSEIFQQKLSEGEFSARPGVMETIDRAREPPDMKIALVTSTAHANVTALLNTEIFFSRREAQILIERWLRNYNTFRPTRVRSCIKNPPRPLVGRNAGQLRDTERSSDRRLRMTMSSPEQSMPNTG